MILNRYYGDLKWWPADTPFEVMIGAVLTQNTAWSNVELAIKKLKAAKVLSLSSIRTMDSTALGELIRSSGFFRQKSGIIQRLVGLIDSRYGGSVKGMATKPFGSVRSDLLATKGIGPETADSILLYALNQPLFVVDAYTRRIFGRLGLLSGRESYEEIRSLFERKIESKLERGQLVPRYKQYHALIVQLAKDHCKKNAPSCSICPLAVLKRCSYTLSPS